jgi:hypothetical protein
VSAPAHPPTHDELSCIDQSARYPQAPARAGGEFFLTPPTPTQRRYEALRAYLAEGVPAAEAAARFGYTTASLLSAVRDFRAGGREFFLSGRSGPKTAPAKDAARQRILELRAAGHSIDEIAAALATEGIPLNRTGIAEVIAAEGLPRIWRRPEAARGPVRREVQPRAEIRDVTDLPAQAETRLAGLLLAIPDLLALDLPGMVAAAGYPSSPRIPALSYLLSLLALKLTATRRVSHVYDLAAYPGAAAFAGLVALPKATALTTYSYRLDHGKQRKFLAALDTAALAAGLATGGALNLDFHAVMHWGEDAALEKHYVPRRSQRTRSVLTFFAEDADTHTLLYGNADLSKATQAGEVLAFADHWKTVTGRDPGLLIFDSKVTTQAQLAELDARGIRFITLRAAAPNSPRRCTPCPPRPGSRSPWPAPAANAAGSGCTKTPPPPSPPTPAPSANSPSPASATTNPPSSSATTATCPPNRSSSTTQDG